MPHSNVRHCIKMLLLTQSRYAFAGSLFVSHFLPFTMSGWCHCNRGQVISIKIIISKLLHGITGISYCRSVARKSVVSLFGGVCLSLCKRWDKSFVCFLCRLRNAWLRFMQNWTLSDRTLIALIVMGVRIPWCVCRILECVHRWLESIICYILICFIPSQTTKPE